MKLNNESKKLIDILNVYLEELNEEYLSDKDSLDALIDQKNIDEQLKKSKAQSSVKFNAFAPRVNDTTDDESVNEELNNKIKSLEEKVNLEKEKIESIQSSIDNFINAFNSIPDPEEIINKNDEKANDELDKKSDIEKETSSDKNTEKEIVEIIKEVPCETINNKKLKIELSSVSSKLDNISYTSVYNYKNTSKEINSVKKLLDEIIDNM